MIYEKVSIGDVASLNPRLTAENKPKPEELVSFVPMAAVSEKSFTIEKPVDRPFAEVAKGFTPFQRGDILVAKITPCFENGKIAFTNDLPRDLGFGSTEFHVLRPYAVLDGKYLFYLLRGPFVRKAGEIKMKGAAGQRRVPSDFFAQLQIPLPPLPEQKRIAAILDAADALRAKRRESLAQLDVLLQSTFLDMFADSDSFELTQLKNLASSEKYSLSSGPFGSSLTSKHYVDNGVLVLRGLNVSSGSLNLDDCKYVSKEKAQELARSAVKSNDIVIVAVGSSGQAFLIPEDFPQAVLSQNFNKITPDEAKVHPVYLVWALNSPFVQQQFSKNITDTVRTFLSLTKVKSANILLAPLDLQHRFASIVQSIETQKTRLRAHLAELDTLFASLQSRAFNGEL